MNAVGMEGDLRPELGLGFAPRLAREAREERLGLCLPLVLPTLPTTILCFECTIAPAGIWSFHFEGWAKI